MNYAQTSSRAKRRGEGMSAAITNASRCWQRAGSQSSSLANRKARPSRSKTLMVKVRDGKYKRFAGWKLRNHLFRHIQRLRDHGRRRVGDPIRQ